MGGKVLIAMSGGVDSSAAALLLREWGYACIGCTMKLYGNAGAGVDRRRTCCSLDDVEDARAAAFRLGIPCYVFNFREDFRRAVMEKSAGSYDAAGCCRRCWLRQFAKGQAGGYCRSL